MHWGHGDPIPGMFVFAPRPDQLPEGAELVGGLPPFAVRQEMFKDLAWNAGYYCLKCMPDAWGTRRACTAELLQRCGPLVFPQAGDRGAPARARADRLRRGSGVSFARARASRAAQPGQGGARPRRGPAG